MQIGERGASKEEITSRYPRWSVRHVQLAVLDEDMKAGHVLSQVMLVRIDKKSRAVFYRDE